MDVRIGVEEEYFLLDKDTLTPGILSDELFDYLTCTLSCNVQRELKANQVELNTKVCSSISELADEIYLMRAELAKALKVHNLTFMCSGSHPSVNCRKIKVARKKHYKNYNSSFHEIVRDFGFNGLHIHIECMPWPDKIKLINHMRCLLPTFVLLSTSSPFHNKHQKSQFSSRLQEYKLLNYAGIHSFIKDKESHLNAIALLKESGIVSESHNWHWHQRIHHHYPTVELRIADACPDLKTSVALSALYLCLSHTLLEKDPKQLRFHTDDSVIIEGYLSQAIYKDLDEAKFIDIKRQCALPAKEAIVELLSFVRDKAIEFNCVDELNYIYDIFKNGTSAEQQIKVYQETGSLEAVTRDLIKKTNQL